MGATAGSGLACGLSTTRVQPPRATVSTTATTHFDMDASVKASGPRSHAPRTVAWLGKPRARSNVLPAGDADDGIGCRERHRVVMCRIDWQAGSPAQHHYRKSGTSQIRNDQEMRQTGTAQ